MLSFWLLTTFLLFCATNCHPIYSGLYPYTLPYGQQAQQAQPEPQQLQSFQPGVGFGGTIQYPNNAIQAQVQPAAIPSQAVNSYRPDTYNFGYPTQQDPQQAVQADGSYSYRSPDGQIYTINYSAGQNGYQTSPALGGLLNPNGYPAQDVSSPLQQMQQIQQAPVQQQVPIQQQQAQHQPFSFFQPQVPAQSGFQAPLHYPFNQLAGQQQLVYPSADLTGQQVQPEIFQTTTIEQHHTINHPFTFTPPVTQPAPAPVSNTGYGNPFGFTYGSNNQALQQMQKLLYLR